VADKLSEYRAKRKAGRTPEPGVTSGRRASGAREERQAGGRAEPATGGRFVVHEHHARNLHWDLRLEHDGALASWAVPKGVPDDPRHNRLAVRTEDHPLEYIDFHGEIPAGSYGAGTMKIWDSGTYDLEKWRQDEVIVNFHGRRLSGRYALFQTGKGKDAKNWMIHRMDPPVDPAAEEMPRGIVPMMAKLATLPRDDTGWAYEIKWDGERAIAYSEPGSWSLESRSLREITAQYPEVRALNDALGSHRAVLDGEIVAFDDEGRPSFERLQPRMHVTSAAAIRRRAAETPVSYVLFDLLYLDGHTLMSEPYRRRRELLEQLDLNGPTWQTPPYHTGDGAELLEATRRQRLEGLVAKRIDSRYEPGRRSGAWIKIKNTGRQEFVIGGWLPGEGRRRDRIGALLLGYYERDSEGVPRLRYAGRVGTGFTEAELDALAKLLAPLERDESPFTGRQPGRGAHFVEPQLVAEVEFREWTKAKMLRAPSYKGLRDDKDPLDVVLEAPDADAASTETAASNNPTRRNNAARRKTPADTAVPLDVLALPREGRAKGAEIELEGRQLKLSNLDKVLYPKVGFTKGQVIDYYLRVGPWLLPHLHDRPLTLKRYPDGVEGEFFYEKNCPKHRPSWFQTVAVPRERGSGTIDYCMAQDLPSLVWVANLASLELHTSLSHADALERPTMVVFDLDPGAPAGLLECCEVGLMLQGMFEQLGVRCLAKTSGSKGLQVYLPLNSPDASYEQTKPFAKAVAETLGAGAPELVVSRMTKQLRRGKVLVDWSQNDVAKTTVCVYSLRALEHPSVSTPVSWEEVRAARDSGDADKLRFDAPAVLARTAEHGDLFADVLNLQQQLPRV
jgi:bifunctional non-homologous end joining protein LigD